MPGDTDNTRSTRESFEGFLFTYLKRVIENLKKRPTTKEELQRSIADASEYLQPIPGMRDSVKEEADDPKILRDPLLASYLSQSDVATANQEIFVSHWIEFIDHLSEQGVSFFECALKEFQNKMIAADMPFEMKQLFIHVLENWLWIEKRDFSSVEAPKVLRFSAICWNVQVTLNALHEHVDSEVVSLVAVSQIVSFADFVKGEPLINQSRLRQLREDLTRKGLTVLEMLATASGVVLGVTAIATVTMGVLYFMASMHVLVEPTIAVGVVAVLAALMCVVCLCCMPASFVRYLPGKTALLGELKHCDTVEVFGRARAECFFSPPATPRHLAEEQAEDEKPQQ